jgi:hypothetical protein
VNKLLIYRDVGTTWDFVGESDLESVDLAGINNFTLGSSISVQAGDIIAWWYPEPTTPSIAFIAGLSVTLGVAARGEIPRFPERPLPGDKFFWVYWFPPVFPGGRQFFLQDSPRHCIALLLHRWEGVAAQILLSADFRRTVLRMPLVGQAEPELLSV